MATAAEVGVLADGAPWIWNLCTREFPQASPVLDYYPLTQPLSTVAHTRYPGAAARATAWGPTCQAFLDRDPVAPVLLTLQNWEPTDVTARAVRDCEAAFLANHAERMRYGTDRARAIRSAAE